MNELKYVTAQPFRRTGKNVLTEREFVFSLSMDFNWFTPDEAAAVIKKGVEHGLLQKDNDSITPKFDINIDVPSGFSPKMVFKEKSTFDLIVERIISRTGQNKYAIISLVNKENEKLLKLVNIEVSALIVAKEKEIEVPDLADKVYKELTQKNL